MKHAVQIDCPHGNEAQKILEKAGFTFVGAGGGEMCWVGEVKYMRDAKKLVKRVQETYVTLTKLEELPE